MPTALKGSPFRRAATLVVVTPRKTAATPDAFSTIRAIRHVGVIAEFVLNPTLP